MQGLKRSFQRVTRLFYAFACVGEFFAVASADKRKSIFDGSDYFAFVGRLAGVEFETEFSYAYFGKTFFDDLERGLFFRDEQYAFSVINRVGDYISNRLALARSGGTVQNESRTLCRFRDSRILGTVAGQRSYYFAGFAVVLAGA